MPANSQVIHRSPDDLRGYEGNARTHSTEQIAQIAASIAEFGFTNPILITPDGMVVAGHGRLEAARLLDMDDVPTLTVGADWSPEQIRAYVLADNQIALNAGWDQSILAAELAALQDSPALAMTGFDAAAVAQALLRAGRRGDPDAEAPVPPQSPVSQAGDVWLLGSNRIICGDSTDPETVAALLAGAKPHLMVTDPPYGVEYDADWRNKALRADGSPSDGRAVGKVSNDDRADWREAWALFPGDVAYVWHADRHASAVQASLEAAAFEIRCQIVWAKSVFAIGRGDYHRQHEPCWYAVRKGRKGHWAGDRKQTTLWQIDKPRKSETGHSTQKPIECMRRPIENNSRPGDAVYEPFSGSGTTIIAGEMTGRRVFAVELSPSYVDVAVLRWQEFTGSSATLVGTDETFANVAGDRMRQGV